MRRSRATGALALVAGTALLVSACSGGGSGGSGGTTGGQGGLADCSQHPNTCNSAPVKDGGTMTYTIEKDIKNWNVNSSDGNVLMMGMLAQTFQPETFMQTPDEKFKLDKRYMESAKQVNDDPQTIVYKINPKATWADGTPFNVKDFIYQWQTQDIKDCPKCSPANTSGYTQIKDIKGSDNGKTVTVTFDKPYTDWQGLFTTMLPAHIAAKHGGTDTPEGRAKSFEWFGANVPKWSGGPFKIQNFEANKAVTLVPNPKWAGKGPHLDKLIFRIITDASAEPDALRNHEVDFIYPQPEVDLIQQVKQMPNVSYTIGAGLTWEHFDLNLAKPYFKNDKLRDAIMTAIDRKTLKSKTVDQFTDKIKIDNNHLLVPGLEGYQDNVTTVSSHGQGKIKKAKKTLTSAGYKIQGGKLIQPSGKPFPDITCKYTTGNQIRKTECTLIGQQVKKLGINMTTKPISDLGGTLDAGQFDSIVYAWVGTPFPFSGAQQIWTIKGGNDFGKMDDPKVVSLLKKAASQTNRQKAYKLLNEADKQITRNSYSLPLYQKPTMLAGYDKFANIRDNATSVGPPYNSNEWGLRK